MYKSEERQFTYGENEDGYIDKYDGYGGFICKKCGYITIRKIYYEYKSDNDIFAENILVSVKCDKCGHEDMYEITNDMIDPNMCYAIYHLNRKGYPTKYCCEGHPYGQYIQFSYYQQNEIVKYYPLPYPWYVDTSIYSPDDFTFKKFIIRCSMYNDSISKQTIIDVLNEWVDKLPVYAKRLPKEPDKCECNKDDNIITIYNL